MHVPKVAAPHDIDDLRYLSLFSMWRLYYDKRDTPKGYAKGGGGGADKMQVDDGREGRPRLPRRFLLSWTMLLTLIAVVLFHHMPTYNLSYEKRWSVLHHFLGSDFLSKENGQIVRWPTVYIHTRGDFLHKVENFVTVFYRLARRAENELRHHYYTNAHAGNGERFLEEVLWNEAPHRRERAGAVYYGDMNNSGDVDDEKERRGNFTLIDPVDMEVEMFTFALREHRGHSGINSFHFSLTEEDPVGPFAMERNSEDKDGDYESEMRAFLASPLLIGDGIKASTVGLRGGNSSMAGLIRKACTPRQESISGLFYAPCRRLHNATGAAGKDGLFFSLVDNVHHLRLRGALPQVISVLSDGISSASGFKTVVYKWVIEANFAFTPGGVVEVTYNIVMTTKYMDPLIHPRFFMTAAIFLFTILDVIIRCYALKQSAISRRAMKVADSMWREAQEVTSACDVTEECTLQYVGDQIDIGVDKLPEHGENDVEPSPHDFNQTAENSFLVNRVVNQFGQWLQTQADRISLSCGGGPGSDDAAYPPITFMDLYERWRSYVEDHGGEEWHIFGLVADAITLLYLAFFSVRLYSLPLSCFYDAVENITLGLSAFFLSVNLLAQSRYYPKTHFTVQAMIKLISQLFFALASMMPMFFGFVFLYCIVFGPHSEGRFTTLDYSSITLYFMMFGDSLLPAIAAAGGSSSVVGTLLANFMTIVFVLLVIITLNLAMSITQYHWVRQHRKIGGNDTLLTFRTREDVKKDLVETIAENIEMLLRLQDDDPREGVSRTPCND